MGIGRGFILKGLEKGLRKGLRKSLLISQVLRLERDNFGLVAVGAYVDQAWPHIEGHKQGLKQGQGYLEGYLEGFAEGPAHLSNSPSRMR